jgi:photosystem II stability/assembly factor-like uncharacterized protein
VQNTPLISPIPLLIYSIDFTDSLHGVAVGDEGVILKTNDGGLAWDTVPRILLFGDYHYELRTIQLINDTLGYAAGGRYNGSTAIFLKTTDGGNSWIKILESHDFPVFLQMEFLNDTLGFASGSCHQGVFCNRSKISKTTDGGFTWNVIYADNADELRSIDVVGNSIYSVGYLPSKIVYSPDFGINWGYQNPLNITYPYQVFFTDLLTGYIVGDSGRVLKTTNGGVGFYEITHSSKNLINIFPNPVRDNCIVKASLFYNATLFIYDFTGRKLLQLPFNTQAQINFSSLTPGIYFAEVKDENSKSVKGKIVKE